MGVYVEIRNIYGYQCSHQEIESVLQKFNFFKEVDDKGNFKFFYKKECDDFILFYDECLWTKTTSDELLLEMDKIAESMGDGWVVVDEITMANDSTNNLYPSNDSDKEPIIKRIIYRTLRTIKSFLIPIILVIAHIIINFFSP